MSKRNTTNLPPGTLVIAPNHDEGSRERGTIIDNLNTMYFIEYESGNTGFVFKVEHIELQE